MRLPKNKETKTPESKENNNRKMGHLPNLPNLETCNIWLFQKQKNTLNSK